MEIFITSLPGEGKSTLARGMAEAYSRQLQKHRGYKDIKIVDGSYMSPITLRATNPHIVIFDDIHSQEQLELCRSMSGEGNIHLCIYVTHTNLKVELDPINY